MDRSRLTVANEFVRIDDTSNAPAISRFGAGLGLVGPHHAAATLNDNIILAACNLGRQGDLKLYGRADFESSIGANIHARGAEIASHAAMGVVRAIFPVNLDRQMQRKPFSGTRF